MKIHTYKEIEFSEITLQELSNDLRIDADFYQPQYLRAIDAVVAAGSEPLGDLQAEITHPTEIKRVYSDEGIQILLAKNIRNNVLDFNTTVFMPESARKALARNKLIANDVVMTRSGANYGQTSYYLDEPVELFACADCLVIRTNRLNGLYLSTYLNCSYGKLLVDRGSYGMAQPHIAPSYLYKLPVPMPSTHFQKQLEKLIKRSFQQKHLADKLYTDAENLLLKELGLLDWQPDTVKFTLGSREFEVEDTSTETTLSDVLSSDRIDAEHFQPKFTDIINHVESLDGCVSMASMLTLLQRGKQPQYTESGIPVVNSKHVAGGQVRIDAENAHALPTSGALTIQFGDVLMNGTGVGTIGRCAPFLQESTALPDNHVTIIRPIPNSIEPIYLSIFLNSIAGQFQVGKRLRGSSGQIELYPKDIAQFKIWLAPTKIQQNISKKVEDSFKSKEQSRQLLDQAKRAVELFIEEGEEAALQAVEKVA